MAQETEQEAFWRGACGDAYVDRSSGPALDASRLSLWSAILRRTRGVGSVIELGCNLGLNLRALRRLRPEARLGGVEINAKAAAQVRAWGEAEVIEGSLLERGFAEPADLAFTSGVLIHIAPERLAEAYAALMRQSRRYVLVAEYYNPSPVEISYRGHAERLYKRDFAGELMDAYPELSLVDYGFVWRRDPVFAGDDVTWFLMEKR
jgi:pseudaminic acid biosynthesis-associated methylase